VEDPIKPVLNKGKKKESDDSEYDAKADETGSNEGPIISEGVDPHTLPPVDLMSQGHKRPLQIFRTMTPVHISVTQDLMIGFAEYVVINMFMGSASLITSRL
jgi:hypothetical protein